MRVSQHFVYLLALGLMFVLYLRLEGEKKELETHVDYLEVYIQENNLPTPAFRIDTDRFHIRIGE